MHLKHQRIDSGGPGTLIASYAVLANTFERVGEVMVMIKLHSMFNTVNYNAGVVRSFDDEGARIEFIADVPSLEERGNR